MIDWDRVLELQKEVGEDDFHEVVDMFLDEVNGEIKTLVLEHGAAELEAKLHFLKGAALNLGLNAFAELCRVGEDLARNGRSSLIDKNAIVSSYKDSIQEFSSIVTNTAAA